MAATLQCTLHRATAKQPLPPPPPIVLTLAGGGVTERTEEYTEFKEGQASLGETVLSLKCELVPHGSGKGYHKKEVFLAIKEAGLGGHRTLGMAKLDAADMRYLSDGGWRTGTGQQPSHHSAARHALRRVARSRIACLRVAFEC